MSAEKIGQAMRLLIGAQESVGIAVGLLAEAKASERKKEEGPRFFGEEPEVPTDPEEPHTEPRGE